MIEMVELRFCDECGSNMDVRKDSEFGPITIWRCECGMCGHQLTVSIGRVVRVEQAGGDWP